MLESDLTHAAMRLAYAAHHGQLDKAGVPYMDYWDYIRALRYHPVARTVKLADLSHNGDASRLACLPPAEQARLQAKYDQARAILEGVLP